MAGTQNGEPGLSAASHVMGGHEAVGVHAPIPRQQMEDKAAGGRDQQTNGKNVTCISVQVKFDNFFSFSQ